MKKKILICYLFIMFLSLFTYSSFASTNVKERTSSNLHVGKNITVTSANKQSILKTPYVDAEEKIYDFANLFSSSEEKELYNLAINYINNKNIDLVIVTINENNKSNAMKYADDFYDYNDFGIGTNYSGILLLIDMDNRKVWISTTGDAISLYTDSYLDKMLDTVQSNLKSKKYFNGAKSFINLAKEKEYSTSSYSRGQRTPEQRKLMIFIFAIIGFIISVIISSIFCAAKSFKHKPIKISNNANDYLDSSSFKVTNRNDNFINSNTIKIPKADSYSNGSSGHSGSSTHSSSSGTSHGGGGRSF